MKKNVNINDFLPIYSIIVIVCFFKNTDYELRHKTNDLIISSLIILHTLGQ